jgi:hypothetical protein
VKPPMIPSRSSITHGRRQQVHFEVTAHPTAAWVWRQLIEATPWNRKPDFLIHDRDRVWGADLDWRTSWLSIKSPRTPIRAPRANAIAERWVRTVRGDCLDQLTPLSERHLRAILTEFVHYYNHDRPIAASACSLRLHGRRVGTAESLSDLFSADYTMSTSGPLIGWSLPPYSRSSAGERDREARHAWGAGECDHGRSAPAGMPESIPVA